MRFQNEQNQPSKGLIYREVKKTKQSSPPLAEGQLWKTDTSYILIWHIGKRLIDYKMMKETGKKAGRTKATGIGTLQEYLKAQKAVLVNAAPA